MLNQKRKLVVSFVALACGSTDPLLAETFNGTTYEWVKTPMTQEAAQAHAVSLGGNLVAINSEAENNFIFSLINGSDISEFGTASDGGGISYVWLGGNDSEVEGVWQWINGDTWAADSYTNWGTIEPDDYFGQDGLAMGAANWPEGANDEDAYGKAGQWNDIRRSNELSFIVEYPSLTTFKNGEIADADDVNKNFQLLDNKITDLEARKRINSFVTDENSIFADGWYAAGVDCTGDDTALITAWPNLSTYPRLQLTVTGTCKLPEFTNGNGALSVLSQDLHLMGQDVGDGEECSNVGGLVGFGDFGRPMILVSGGSNLILECLKFGVADTEAGDTDRGGLVWAFSNDSIRIEPGVTAASAAGVDVIADNNSLVRVRRSVSIDLLFLRNGSIAEFETQAIDINLALVSFGSKFVCDGCDGGNINGFQVNNASRAFFSNFTSEVTVGNLTATEGSSVHISTETECVDVSITSETLQTDAKLYRTLPDC